MANLKRQKKTRFDKKLLVISGVLMITLFILVAVAQTPQNTRSRAQGLANCTVNSSAELEVSPEEKTMVDMLNAYRRQKGLTDLKISPTLTRAATWLSIDINSTKKLEHVDSLGRSMAVRLAQCGYEGNTAENISNRGDMNNTFSGWQASPVHNTNMLNATYSVVGIAKVGVFWTMDFGSEDDSTTQPPAIPDDTGNNTTNTTVPSAIPSQNTVPSPNFLGPAPSNMAQPSQAPSDTSPSVSPDSPVDNTISGFPENPADDGNSTDNPETIDAPNGSGGGFIVIILQFFKALLELLLSLLGGGK